jgi:anti-sigma regulatory factor (Ser/Thr protein kinase)
VASALVAVIDSDLATMRYASAGHPPPMLAGPTISARSLTYGSAPLGVAEFLDFQTWSIDLEPDAVILFYTDGVTEFRRDIEATEAALLNAVTNLVGDPVEAHPAAALQRAVMGFETPSDDAVLMIVQLTPPLAAELPVEEGELRKKWAFHSSDAYSAHVARHELMSFMRRFDAPEDGLFPAELVLGEILANTVEHAPGIVTIDIDWTATCPVLTIADTGPGLLRFDARLPEDNLDESGRGLFLISTLAKDLRIEPGPGTGTRLTVVLPVARRSSSLRAHAAAS